MKIDDEPRDTSVPDRGEDGANLPPPARVFGWSLFGLLVALLGILGVGLWAATTAIDGAVIASAQVVVESNRKAVQHFEGGIVREVHVQEGALVHRGEVLLNLDTTRDKGDLVASQDRLLDLKARRVRLLSELRDTDTIAWPDSVAARATEARIAAVVAAQERLFQSRRAARAAEAKLLSKRAAAFAARIAGLKEQSDSLRREFALTSEENELVSALKERSLVPTSQLLEVRRNLARLKSRLAEGNAERLSLQAQIEETEAQRAQLDAAFRESAASELTTVQAEIAQLEERHAFLRDRLARRSVRAPQTGRVLNLSVHAAGAVVTPGATLMEIVPVDDELVLRARIPATEVERVRPGLAARVRLTAFNLNSTPELTGTVESLAADADIDPETGKAYYRAQVRLSADQLERLGNIALTPGMPAEVMVRTGERLVVSYLSRPLTDGYARAFRDE